MNWIILSTIVILIASSTLGYVRLIYLHQLTIRRLTLVALIAVIIYSLMLWLFKEELLSEAVAGAITANVYASVTGFFLGSAFEQYRLRIDGGTLLYMNRSFLSDFAPAIIGIGLITFGVYRSALISELPMTPIRVTSGLSFLAIGVWGFTLKVVPEFRKHGIIMIDRIINWDDMLSYSWYTEEVIVIEFEENERIKEFHTIIPPEDQVTFEKMLKKQQLESKETTDKDQK